MSESADLNVKKPYHSYISRKRYEEIQKSLSDQGIERVDDIMRTIRTVLNFDPNNNRFVVYKAEMLRQKAAETGLSVYVLSGGKRYADRQKAARQQQQQQQAVAAPK